jgi:malate synthase
MTTAEDMHRLLPAVDVETSPDGRQDPCVTELPSPPMRTAAISRSGFLDHIDSCVRHFAALLGGRPGSAWNRDSAPPEHSRVQLWRWLHDADAVLDDGTPIDFALFDTAIQRVGERLPRRGLPGQENVLQAAWLLAELTHARTLAEAEQVPTLARMR